MNLLARRRAVPRFCEDSAGGSTTTLWGAPFILTALPPLIRHHNPILRPSPGTTTPAQPHPSPHYSSPTTSTTTTTTTTVNIIRQEQEH
ncbi:hypothetical protein E2C01_053363 [Portunus trituberculatus]|uniref:Uncharacterized protein n=1 Tax=Portunus trituberculatus TaxID=210409 RepID=A0A5B7GRU7_PORTR|nr:hypothetical protein [Portunus trituberculatus]